MARVATGTGCRGRRWLSTTVFHFFIHIIYSSLGADEALEVGFDEDFQGGGLLVYGLGENIETGEERLGIGGGMHLGQE